LIKFVVSLSKKFVLLSLRIIIGGEWYARKIGVKLGSNCRIYTQNFGSEPFLITIGDRVTITSGVKILTHDGSTWLVRDGSGVRYQKYAPVTIGNDVFIGVNSIIMPGVSVGNRVIIGAGSVVTKSVPDNTVVAGTPARFIMDFDSYEKKIKEVCVLDNELSHVKNYKDRVFLALRLQTEKRKLDS
jgi:acetyltransferase-like isoleucine patch superfamily enzyme